MKKLMMCTGLFFACLFFCANVQAISDLEFIYPPLVQNIESTVIFSGDRHHQFKGDYVAVLSDGSAWKIHPDCKETYAQWQPGEAVIVKVRTDRYFFTREHKFALYNYNREETVKAMIVQHKEYPFPLQVIASKKKNMGVKIVRSTDGTVWEADSITDFQTTIVKLSDGTVWEVDSVTDFHIGARVYIGVKEDRHIFSFVFISGDQRQAVWTYAKPKF